MRKPKITYQFLGGLGDGIHLTGSMCIVTVSWGKNLVRFAVDAGLWQGHFPDAFKENTQHLKAQEIKKLDFIILTHAHIDHVGRLPLLFKLGFCGPVYCTEPTARIIPAMLLDTAKIMASENRYRNSHSHNKDFSHGDGRKSKNRGKTKKKNFSLKEKFEILFSASDVETCLARVRNQGLSYNTWHRVAKQIHLKFYPSGHILGGAIVVIRIGEDEPIFLGFCGDLGRHDGVILPPPQMPEEKMDVWVTESTYGGNIHPPREDEFAEIKKVILENKNGKIIIPSFALERAQEIIYLLSQEMKSGSIPKINIFLDSPLASKITGVFSYYWKTPMFLDQGDDFNPFSKENGFLQIVENEMDSATLVNQSGPYIVIAGSGMCDAGRVRNYLRASLSGMNNHILLVGYMANGTLGEKLAKSFPMISMNGQEISVRAKIHHFRSFSAHADGQFLAEFGTKIIKNNGKIFICHGEEKSAYSLQNDLRKLLGDDIDIHIPRQGELITI